MRSIIAVALALVVGIALFAGRAPSASVANANVSAAYSGDVKSAPLRTSAVPRDGRVMFDAASRPQLTIPGRARRPVSSILKVDGPLHFGEFVWNDRGVPAGRIWIRVDLRTQMISVFRAGHEIGTSLILYGANTKPTPPGVFPILARLKKHRSSLYDADMPYTLRLTHDGVAIHASRVRDGAATHGCIGVPEDFAARLFAQARVGDDVVIVRSPPTASRPTASAPTASRPTAS